MKFRKIQASDNERLAQIIRKTLESFGLNIPGTVYTDPTTDNLYGLFLHPSSVYFVAENSAGEVIGGCGLYPTRGLPDGYAELVKLYLSEESRGRGIGRALMEKCHEWAREKGLRHIYLETFGELSSAVTLYQNLGYQSLPGPLGKSGHDACTIWMEKNLSR